MTRYFKNNQVVQLGYVCELNAAYGLQDCVLGMR